ncbi:hypothetical protein [Aphanothece minutissima]|uniref:hypothetical protein n=1 Tax=Aphanothece minutissima TaxID=543815 RepID=UPI0025706308|nr:hypothetical protein [Aphanothece minutissima]
MHPPQRVVLAPGVVVAALAAAHLIAHQQHRHPGSQQQGGQQVAQLPVPQAVDAGIAAGALDAVVPAVVVVVAVTVVLAVGQVVLAVEADQVRQGEAVVGGEEVDRAPHRRGLAVEQIRIA